MVVARPPATLLSIARVKSGRIDTEITSRRAAEKRTSRSE
jgi:hypothetical protein